VPTLIDLERQAEILSIKTGLAKEEILRELKEIKETTGKPDKAALAIWKSRHRFQLVSSMPTKLEGIVLGKEAQRTAQARGQEIEVQNVWVLLKDNLELHKLTLWRENTALSDYFTVGKIVRFSARQRRKRILAGTIGEVEEVADGRPFLDELYNQNKLVKIGDIYSNTEITGADKVVYGVVGRIIKDNETPIGIEISDPHEDSPPISVFVGGQFGRASEETLLLLSGLQEGDEVYAFGFISWPEGQDPRINARGLIR